MTPLPDVLRSKILSFSPETTHAQVSKAFAVWTRRAQELEWQALRSNPLLEAQVKGIQEGIPLCFKRLLNEQREAFLTSTVYDKFVAEQRAFAGSYSRARFERGVALLVEDAEEQDRNLERAWRGNHPITGIAWELGVNPTTPGTPQTAAEIRAYLDAPANQAAIHLVSYFRISDAHLTGIPPEVAKFPMLSSIDLAGNQIRKIPKEILHLRNLAFLRLYKNRFDHIPESLLRYQGSTFLYKNPITRFSEEMYDGFFDLENWLGKRFGTFDYFSCFGFGYLFSIFDVSQDYYANRHITFSKDGLTEIPFALWLREKLFVSNVIGLLGDDPEHDLRWMPDCLKWTLIFSTALIALVLSPLLWLLNQTLSLVVVPIVTKVRELLGYGRMIRLNREGA